MLAEGHPKCAVHDLVLVKAGETVRIRDNEERREIGQMPVMAREKIVFCSCEQFWDAVKLACLKDRSER